MSKASEVRNRSEEHNVEVLRVEPEIGLCVHVQPAAAPRTTVQKKASGSGAWSASGDVSGFAVSIDKVLRVESDLAL